MDSVPNLNENPVLLRNEHSQSSHQDAVPQVRKISRFQVSHVKEMDDSVKPLPTIVHATDVLLENISPPEQQQQQQHQQHQHHQQRQGQVAQDFVTHNIQSAIDPNSPDQHQFNQLSGQIQAQNDVSMQPQSQIQQQTTVNYQPLIESSQHVINQQHSVVSVPVASMPQQMIATPVGGPLQQQQQPTIVSQQQIKYVLFFFISRIYTYMFRRSLF